MIASGLVLFLLGTAVSAGPLIPSLPTEIVISKNLNSFPEKITEYYSSPDKAPFISNFIQKGTNVFFKPQFMLSAEQMPPQIQEVIAAIEKDDCKTLYPLGPLPVMPVMDEPLRIIEKEFAASPEIKEIIEINTVPQQVIIPETPLVIEEPCLTGELERVIIPKVESAPIIVKIEETKAPIVVPLAPELPAFEKLMEPVFIKEVASVPETEKVEVLETIRPVVIPEAPELPSYVPVELPAPVFVEEPISFKNAESEVEIIETETIPTAPVLLPLEMSKVVVEEAKIIPEDKLFEITQPIIIPEAPLLQPYISEYVEAPIISELIEEKPLVIPQAPELPPFTLPKLPVDIVEEKLEESPALLATVEIVEEIVEPKIIPEAPILPTYVPLEPSVKVEDPVKMEVLELKPVVIPPAPVLPEFKPEPFVELTKKPIIVETPTELIVAPCPPEKEAELVHATFESKPIMSVPFAYPELSLMKPVLVPTAPLLPEFMAPYMLMDNKNVVKESAIIDSPHLTFPADCAHDVVLQHILPNLEKKIRPHSTFPYLFNIIP